MYSFKKIGMMVLLKRNVYDPRSKKLTMRHQIMSIVIYFLLRHVRTAHMYRMYGTSIEVSTVYTVLNRFKLLTARHQSCLEVFLALSTK